MLCREQVAQLRDGAGTIRTHGADLAVVGNGTPAQAAAFADELAVDFPVLTDPPRRTYAALGARRGPSGVLRPGTFASAWRAWRGGHRQAGVQGHATQLGGVVVIAPSGDAPDDPASARLLFLQRSRHAGDHPGLDAIAAALSAV
jgi:hypothetical protein